MVNQITFFKLCSVVWHHKQKGCHWQHALHHIKTRNESPETESWRPVFFNNPDNGVSWLLFTDNHVASCPFQADGGLQKFFMSDETLRPHFQCFWGWKHEASAFPVWWNKWHLCTPYNSVYQQATDFFFFSDQPFIACRSNKTLIAICVRL